MAKKPARDHRSSRKRGDGYYQDRDGNWVKQGGGIEFLLHPHTDYGGLGRYDGCLSPGTPGRRSLGCESNNQDEDAPSDTLEIRIHRHRWVNSCGEVSQDAWCACGDWSDSTGEGGADRLRARSATLSDAETDLAKESLAGSFDSSLDAIDREMLTHGWAWLMGTEQLQQLTRSAICAAWVDLVSAKNATDWADEIVHNLLFPDVVLSGGGGDNGLLSFWQPASSTIFVDTDHDLWKVWRTMWLGEHRVYSALWPWADTGASTPSALVPLPVLTVVACGALLTSGPEFDACLVRRWEGDRACIGRAIASDLLRTMMDAEKRALERGGEGSWTPTRYQGIGIDNMTAPSVGRSACQPGFRAPNTLLWLLERVAPIRDSNVCHDFGDKPLQLGDCVLNSDFFHVFPTLCNALTKEGKWRFMELDADAFCTPLFPATPF